MTTVAGIEEKYKTLLAADSQVTRGFSKRNGFVKIVQNGEYTFAAAGFARSIQILQYASLPPVPHIPTEDQLDRFFTNEITSLCAGSLRGRRQRRAGGVRDPCGGQESPLYGLRRVRGMDEVAGRFPRRGERC